ncbi:hypothetical protein [uncultured Tateyamaria sp.]|uniref:hypothetical protein n=1 Tax=uncultured Tateyamaria sp. TaxID=455651 RepID=UPI0026283E8B|nr:hypothetical protein [uncultured Tateyamaria sp.]
MKQSYSLARLLTALPILISSSTPLFAHEAWLLTPAEIEDLSRAPIPDLFRSQLWLGVAAAVGFALTLVALRLEPVIAAVEYRVITPIWKRYGDIGPLALRFGLAVMMLLAAFGGLPRHGTEIWTTPTFLVPDMQLTTVAGAQALIIVQIAIAMLLIAGLATRICGVAVIGLSLAGVAIFGPGFWNYTPHFAAPGFILIALGGGRFSCDHIWNLDAVEALVAPHRQVLWRMSHILIGAGFVYLGLAYKLMQPTLLIAILEHGNMPTFGLPMPIIALVMTGVEVLCGALLVTGRLVRPVALAILGAVTFLAIVLGETPLFHANLYGALFVILLAGRNVPVAHRPARFSRVGAV